MDSDAQDLIAFFGEPIHTYSRAEALEDGVLVDVTETAREAGFRIPVALTSACHEDCVEWTEADSARQCCQDGSGRLWDVLWMGRHAVRTYRGRETGRLVYTVYRVPRDGQSSEPEPVQIELHVGPGDDGEPVVTIDLHGG